MIFTSHKHVRTCENRIQKAMHQIIKWADDTGCLKKIPKSHQMGSRSRKSHQNTSNDNPQHTQIRRYASQTIFKKLEPTHTTELALGLFVICQTENILCEAGLPTLAEMRELNNVKTTIRIITNPRHPIRPFCVEPKRTDEYVYRPTTP
jgi:hypothetical protein